MSGDAPPAVPEEKPASPLVIPGEGKIEADTAAGEDEVNLTDLLLPEGKLPGDVRNFSVAYNNSAFEGWVKQKSPVCAASSVAGAWNTALHLGRAGDNSVSQDETLDVLRGIVGEQVRKAEESLKRALLVKSLDDVIDVLRSRVEATGRTIAGRKAMGVTPKECVAMLREHCMDVVAEREPPQQEEAAPGLPENAIESLIDVWQYTRESVAEIRRLEKEKQEEEDKKAKEGGTDAQPEGANAETVTKVASKEDAQADDKAEEATKKKPDADDADETEDQDLLDDDDDDQDNDQDDDPAGGPKKKTGKKKSKAPPAKTLSQIVFSVMSKWLRSTIALAKLNRDPAPSTAGIGNWGISQATQGLCERSGDTVKVRSLMGRGGKCAHRTKLSDDEATITKQWNALRDVFSTPNSCVLFHLTNHYALVFAMRSWTTAEGAHERQILTARKGQRPNTWLSFEETRAILTGWVGYQIFHVYQVPSSEPTTSTAENGETDVAETSEGAAQADPSADAETPPQP